MYGLLIERDVIQALAEGFGHENEAERLFK